MFFLCFDRLLVKHKTYLVFLIIIASLVLIGVLGITNILGIRNSYIIVRLVIKVNRFLIINTRGYLISVPFDIIS
jgi:ABC-type glycerol-3-phosphate transport system permease component